MSDYALYYWPVPFRGQFIRALLAYAEKRWDEYDAGSIATLKDTDPDQQPVAFMGPPVLVDKQANVALAQMPAIAYYLGETLGLLPRPVALRALTLKIVNDANDVIDEITLNGGQQMWTAARWKAFVPRLRHWMDIWEATGRRQGVQTNDGFLLGQARAGVADIVTATLWGTLADKFPSIGQMLDEAAPAIAGLTRRMNALPSLANLRVQSQAQFGDAYCGGQIEQSLRKVVKGPRTP